MLPERALLGDQDAVDELVNTVYASLQTAGPDDPTLETVSTFLRNGGSLETTAKELSVHPNTVRYRLKRAAETTGWDAADAREAYVLRTAIALGPHAYRLSAPRLRSNAGNAPPHNTPLNTPRCARYQDAPKEAVIKVPRLRSNAGNAPSRCVQACSEEAKGIIFLPFISS